MTLLPNKRKGPGTNSEAPPEAIHRQADQATNVSRLADRRRSTRRGRGVERTWWEQALFTVRVLARNGTPFTVADVRALGVAEPPLSQHWGLLFAAAVLAGVVEPAGAELPETGRPRRLWVGRPS